MKNFEIIKQALEYGHMVEAYCKDNKVYCIYSSLGIENTIRKSDWEDTIDKCYETIGAGWNDKKAINQSDLEIKIIPHRYKPLPVGSLVDIIDCDELREMAKIRHWDCKKINMIGNKGVKVDDYCNGEEGQSYTINCFYFPANFITPHIEEEKRETITFMEGSYNSKTFYKNDLEEAIKDLKEVK